MKYKNAIFLNIKVTKIERSAILGTPGILSVENKKDIITIQWCFIKNQRVLLLYEVYGEASF